MFRKCCAALGVVALSFFIFTARGTDVSAQYGPLRAEIDALCARDTLAYHYDAYFDIDAESGDVCCADGNWYCVTNRYWQNESLIYQGTYYVRDKNSLAETDAWFAAPDTPGYNCEERRGLYALVSNLPEAEDLNKVETNGAQTIFSYSRAALKALQEAEIEQLEALAAQTSEEDDPYAWDFIRQSLDNARHTAYTSGTLTISKNRDGVQNIRLELVLETDKLKGDPRGNLVWSDEKESVLRAYSVTVNLRMDPDAIRGQIANAAALPKA